MDNKPESARFSRKGEPPISPEEDVTEAEGGKGKWSYHERTYWEYLDDFERVQDSRTEILDKLKLKDEPIVIDLLAGPAAVRSLAKFLRPKPFKGLAVGFHDPRTPEKIARDTREGVSFIAGDLKDPETWKKIEDWLKGDKADFIMSRGFGGLRHLPVNLEFSSQAIERIWNNLNPVDGTTILQIPPARSLGVNGIPVTRWVDKIKSISPDNVRHVPSYESRSTGYYSYGLVRLDRAPGVVLPTLNVLGQVSQKAA